MNGESNDSKESQEEDGDAHLDNGEHVLEALVTVDVGLVH